MEKSTQAVMVLIDTGFHDVETMYAKYRLEESGYRVFLTGPKAGEKYVGRFGYSCTSELSIYEVHGRHFAGVVCTGAWAPFRLRTEGTVKALVAEMFQARKMVAAICNGPAVLISAGICRGLRMTGGPSVLDDLRNAGAVLGEARVVVDGNVITAGATNDLPGFMKAVTDLLAGTLTEPVTANKAPG